VPLRFACIFELILLPQSFAEAGERVHRNLQKHFRKRKDGADVNEDFHDCFI
jgi:hypothetical protein